MNHTFEESLSNQVIGAAIEVHRETGPGLLESVYVNFLAYALELKGVGVKLQVPIPAVFRDKKLDFGYRMDLLVEDILVVEVKSVEALHPVHFSQVLTYLRLGKFHLGLLINFNVDKLANGVRRVINGF